MEEKLFMIAKNEKTGKYCRFYYLGGQTIQQYNQIIIDWKTRMGLFIEDRKVKENNKWK